VYSLHEKTLRSLREKEKATRKVRKEEPQSSPRDFFFVNSLREKTLRSLRERISLSLAKYAKKNRKARREIFSLCILCVKRLCALCVKE